MELIQLPLFRLPIVHHNQEWIWEHDSAGQGRFFSRPVGSTGPFWNPYAGIPDDPRSPCGNGEYVYIDGNIVDKNGKIIKEKNYETES